MYKKLSPEFIYGLTGLILLITGYVVQGTIDIATHDTYFVFANSQVFILFSLMFVFYSIVSLVFQKMRKPFNRLLFLIHYLITIIGFGWIIYLVMTPDTPVRQFTDFSIDKDLEAGVVQDDSLQWIALIFIFVLLAQIVFIVNMIRSLLQQRTV